MTETKQTITINQPSHTVFEFVLDPKNTPKWVDGVVKELTNESPTKLAMVHGVSLRLRTTNLVSCLS